MAKITKKVRENLLTAILTATQDASAKQETYNKSEQKFAISVYFCSLLVTFCYFC